MCVYIYTQIKPIYIYIKKKKTGRVIRLFAFGDDGVSGVSEEKSCYLFFFHCGLCETLFVCLSLPKIKLKKVEILTRYECGLVLVLLLRL